MSVQEESLRLHACGFNCAQSVLAKKRIAQLTMTFTRDFVKRFGCIRCQDLKRNGVPCDELIAWAAQRAEEIIKENQNQNTGE